MLIDRLEHGSNNFEMIEFRLNVEDVEILYGPKGNQETLLLLEDSSVILNNVKRQVLRHQYQVICATNGVEAWELLQQHKIAAVVSDVGESVGAFGYSAKNDFKSHFKLLSDARQERAA